MLDIKNIYKDFGDLHVLKGVSTSVEKGEVLTIIGVSGSGKSTLLRCMNLLEEPTFGEVWIEGKLMTPVDPYLHNEVIRFAEQEGEDPAVFAFKGGEDYALVGTCPAEAWPALQKSVSAVFLGEVRRGGFTLNGKKAECVGFDHFG